MKASGHRDVIGTHQDLSGPIKFLGRAGYQRHENGRRGNQRRRRHPRPQLKLSSRTAANDPKRAVLASQKN